MQRCNLPHGHARLSSASHSTPVLPILQDELAKCKRSITKRLPEAPHEVLLVLDGTTGLNMLNQARRWGHSSWGWCDSRGMGAGHTRAEMKRSLR